MPGRGPGAEGLARSAVRPEPGEAAAATGEIAQGKAGAEEERSPPFQASSGKAASFSQPLPGPILRMENWGSEVFAKLSQPVGSRAGLNQME